MKAFLMYRDQDFDVKQKLPSNEQALMQDLELDTLLNAMALDDKFLLEVAKSSLLTSLNDVDIILYRQNILRDCLKNPAIVRDIYNIAVEAIESEKKHYWGFSSRSPGTILYVSIEAMQTFVEMLKKLRDVADKHFDQFNSEGFKSLFKMLQNELTDEYFATIHNHLKQLKFRGGILVSAELGKGNKGINYILHKLQEMHQSWLMWILWQLREILPDDVFSFFSDKPPPQTFYLYPRDESGARALGELRDRGINLVANALAQSTEHILSFFNMLRTELAFYIGCLNLHEKLIQKGELISFPVPISHDEREFSCIGLYDICLSLSLKQRVVGNEINADNKDLIIITGANQGGKSTFLRSVGLAQLMMQCGMFVPAESLRANVCKGLFTHYKREEDTSMKSGKLDEELSRMSNIVENLAPNSMILFNESFAATNEREGSEIARQVTSALLEKQIKVFFVTHQYEFAHSYYDKKMENAIFLRAERKVSVHGGGGLPTNL
jgi:DNA mismatch repair ATPase MutS